jgi:hypothetical protein
LGWTVISAVDTHSLCSGPGKSLHHRIAPGPPVGALALRLTVLPPSQVVCPQHFVRVGGLPSYELPMRSMAGSHCPQWRYKCIADLSTVNPYREGQPRLILPGVLRSVSGSHLHFGSGQPAHGIRYPTYSLTLPVWIGGGHPFVSFRGLPASGYIAVGTRLITQLCAPQPNALCPAESTGGHPEAPPSCFGLPACRCKAIFIQGFTRRG